ncbi:SHOCT domain-containing protein [Desertimonas flava]|uniref:SHOCT domain-containing protein n=1 Tax=Desertimonas flava TaxID=2064846 RepID=UPI001968CEF9|nr:SHOCT domain-containing protein [Desertimonas flava]
MLAYDYPILGLLWTLLIAFLLIAWLMLVFRVIVDIFRSSDLGGFAKALWAIFVVVLPWLGTLVYVIARGRSMAQRDVDGARAQEAAFRSYVQDVAGSGTTASTADELAKLHDLRTQGVLTDAEFGAQKARLLA